MKPLKPARHITVALLTGLALTAAALSGCSSSPGAELDPAVTLKPVEGTDRFDVTLSEQASTRLGIATAAVRTATVAATGSPAAAHKVMPYAAVVYDSSGATWAYSPKGTLAYTRVPVTVSSIQGQDAVLDEGPAPGTPVVVVGAAELLGAEAQIAGEQ